MPDRTITNLKRRLERWELEHLRHHAADLAERLERAEQDRDYYREMTGFWHEESMRLITELQEDGAVIGLSKDGEISIISDADPITAALVKAGDFISGFEDDPDQEGIADTLELIHQAIQERRRFAS